MMHSAKYWIEKLNMTAHPEGGWYKETFRDSRKVQANNANGDLKEYNASTAIYFLLDDQTFSAFHRIGASEAWHFYAGTGITIYSIDENGELKTVELEQISSKVKCFRLLYLPMFGLHQG